MNVTIISCSLHPQSRSYVLARKAEAEFAALGVTARFFDLRQADLPFCGLASAGDARDSRRFRATIESSHAVMLAVPIYNYDVNAAAKNLVELTGRAWTDTIVGFLCAAGGRSSYMSVMGLANSLMLDFRCLILPRFVYATGDDFGDDRKPSMYISSTLIQERISQLASEMVRVTSALTSRQSLA